MEKTSQSITWQPKIVFLYHMIAFFDKQDTCDHLMSGSGGCPVEWIACETLIEIVLRNNVWGYKVEEENKQ